ncbi:MAG: glycosyltransferase family 4 protein [Proteobacteria bacterium]|nr:MAG: glycosyltransferase family 4 protein [Pseudomonadota bacterium]
MKLRRIGIILPSLSHGGAERVASVLANNWSRLADCEVHLLTFTNLPRFFSLEGKVKFFDASASKRGFGLLNTATVFMNIRRYIVNQRIDSVLSFMDKYNVFVLLCLAFTRVRVTVSDRSGPRKWRPMWLRILKRATYPWAAGAIAQTRLAAELLRAQTGVKRVETIPNPIRKSASGFGSREKLILSVGRLVPEKGQASLIRAFANFREPDWILAIIGEGELRASLDALARSLGVSDRVRLPGAVTNIDAWYRRASLFVLSSNSEGFPNALVEAMSHGVACISFDCDAGPADIIEDGISGLLLRVGDERGLTKVLTDLARHAERREALGEAARARAQQFGEDVIARRYLEFCLGK